MPVPISDPYARSASPPPALTPLQFANLVALFLPGVLFAAGWLAFRDDERLAWLDPRRGSAHFWIIAVAGLAGTVAGCADWVLHRRGIRPIGPSERRVEFVALAFGGVPLFALMTAASLSPSPGAWLVPAVAVALATTVGICYDELTFHRRCGPIETLCHRGVTLGMGVAWLAWAHGAFVAGPGGG